MIWPTWPGAPQPASVRAPGPGAFLQFSATENLALRGVPPRAPDTRCGGKLRPGGTGSCGPVRPRARRQPTAGRGHARCSAPSSPSPRPGGMGRRPGVLVLDEPTAVFPRPTWTASSRSCRGARPGPASCTSRTASTRSSGSPTRSPCCGAAAFVASRSIEGPQHPGSRRADGRKRRGRLLPRTSRGSRRASDPAERPQHQGPVPRRGRVDLREREVLGVAGLPGSGRNELPYALVGASVGRHSASIQLAGQPNGCRSRSRRASISRSCRRTGPRKPSYREFSVGENISCRSCRRLANRGWVRRGQEKKLVDDWIRLSRSRQRLRARR